MRFSFELLPVRNRFGCFESASRQFRSRSVVRSATRSFPSEGLMCALKAERTSPRAPSASRMARYLLRTSSTLSCRLAGPPVLSDLAQALAASLTSSRVMTPSAAATSSARPRRVCTRLPSGARAAESQEPPRPVVPRPRRYPSRTPGPMTSHSGASDGGKPRRLVRLDKTLRRRAMMLSGNFRCRFRCFVPVETA